MHSDFFYFCKTLAMLSSVDVHRELMFYCMPVESSLWRIIQCSNSVQIVAWNRSTLNCSTLTWVFALLEPCSQFLALLFKNCGILQFHASPIFDFNFFLWLLSFHLNNFNTNSSSNQQGMSLSAQFSSTDEDGFDCFWSSSSLRISCFSPYFSFGGWACFCDA